LELTLFSSSALSFNKFPAVNVQPENRACIAITQLAGMRQYRQNGKVAVLSKGDTTLIDASLPWTSDCLADCARLYLRIPMPILERRFRGARIPNATRISGTHGIGTTLFRLMTSLYEQAGHLTEVEGEVAVEAYLRILSTCLGIYRKERDNQEGSPTPYSQILSYINERLTETTLCPSEIAAASGISVRHLYRLFSQRGSTVNDWIRIQRLKHCLQELSDPLTRRKSITEIALYWGFNDSAHFSHTFKRQFGISPRIARLRPWLDSERVQKTSHSDLAAAHTMLG
jgi:AraC family transcriptional activator of tynA and feaB